MDEKDPDEQAARLEALLIEIRACWEKSDEALEEVMFVVRKVFPEAARWD